MYQKISDLLLSMSATLAPDRLTAVDLTDPPNDNMAALRREAIRRGISLSELVAAEVHDLSDRLVHRPPAPAPPTTTDIIRRAAAGHHAVEPEGKN